jgi:hypothetical protein
MATYLELIQRAIAVRDERSASKATDALFATAPPDKAINEFTVTTRNYPVDLLGYVFFPPVLEHLRRSDELFNQMIALAFREDLPDGFRLVLLDFLQGAAYTRSDREPYWAAMRSLASSASQPNRVRAQAVRNLGQDAGDATEPLIGSLVDSAEPTLVDAAAAAARLRHLGKKGTSDKVGNRLADFARRNPEHALRSGAVLSALAAIRTPAAIAALHSLADVSAEDDDQARLISAAGHVLDDAKLAQILRRTNGHDKPQSEASLQALFVQHPRRLEALADAGYDDEYLDGAMLAVASGDPPPLERLEKIAQRNAPRVAERVRRIAELAPADKLPATIRRQKTEIRLGNRSVTADELFATAQKASPPPRSQPHHEAALIKDPIDLEPIEPIDPPPPWPRPASRAYSTGLHVGCSMNSDLDWSKSGAVTNHWHTGMFLEFVPYSNGTGGTMHGTHAAALTNAVLRFSTSASFGQPGADLSFFLAALRNDFIQRFCNWGNFHGAHTTPGLTFTKRAAIANTARVLYAKGIDYTMWHQLDALWEYPWTGEVHQIARLRCDGLVEYCYEKNAVRVCGGKDAKYWNISGTGTKHVENHDRLHTGAYDPGELCPRIQAGNEGHGVDSTFVRLPASPPEIHDFAVLSAWADPTPDAPQVPSIWFRPVSDSSTIYLRVTVCKEGDPSYYFVQTDHVTDHPFGVAAPLALWQIAANTPRQWAWWQGRTVGGPNYMGQNGRYNFRLVAVDKAGNVSAERSVVADLSW